MAVLRSILTKFGFKVEGGKLVRINQQVGAVKRRLNAATRQARAFRRELGSTANMLRYAAYAFVGSRVVKAFTTDYANAADAAAKLSKAMGINVEFYQALGHATRLSGASQEDVAKGMMQLGKRARDAREGLKKSKDAFKEMGMEVLDSSGKLKNQDVLLFEVADRFKVMENGTAKTALAMEIFGRAGAKIIPLLNVGSDGIKRMMQEARELGIVLSKKAAKDAEDFVDELLRAKGALTGVRNAIAKDLLPKLTDLLRRFQLWYREGNNARRLLGWLKKAARAAAIALGLVVVVKTLRAFSALGGALRTAISGLGTLARAGLLASAKVALIGIVIAALIMAIEDLYVFAKGGDSLVGRALGGTKDAKILRSVLLEMAAALEKMWRAIRPLAQKLLPVFIKVFTYLVVVLATAIGALLLIGYKLGEFLDKAGQKIAAFFRRTKQVFLGIVQAIKDAWAGFKQIISDIANASAGILRSVFGGVFGFIKRGIEEIWGGFIRLLEMIGLIKEKEYKTIGAAVKAGATKLIGKAQKETPGLFRPLLALTTAPIMPLPASPYRSASKGGVPVVRPAHIGALHVHVSGSANMDAPSMKKAVKDGAKEALGDLIKETYRDLKPMVHGAT